MSDEPTERDVEALTEDEKNAIHDATGDYDTLFAAVERILAERIAQARREGAVALDPAYRDIEVCPCSTPGWTHHTGFHDFVAARVECAVKAARREGAAEIMARVQALRDGWDATRCGVTSPGLRRAVDDIDREWFDQTALRKGRMTDAD